MLDKLKNVLPGKVVGPHRGCSRIPAVPFDRAGARSDDIAPRTTGLEFADSTML